MTEASLITEQMRAAIGRPLNFGEPFDVEKGAIRNMAEAMNYLHPLYLDEDYAQGRGHGGVLAPSLFPLYDLRMIAFFDVLKFDFAIAAVVHGSDEWEFREDIHAGDRITPRGKLLDITEKGGSRGRMLLVTSEVTFTNQRGEAVAVYRPTEIFVAS
jgi:hypothetical protein